MEGKGAEMAKDHLDLEEIKRRQQQLVEMKKVKQGQIEAPQVDLEAEKIVPHTVKEKQQNFWSLVGSEMCIRDSIING